MRIEPPGEPRFGGVRAVPRRGAVGLRSMRVRDVSDRSPTEGDGSANGGVAMALCRLVLRHSPL